MTQARAPHRLVFEALAVVVAIIGVATDTALQKRYQHDKLQYDANRKNCNISRACAGLQA